MPPQSSQPVPNHPHTQPVPSVSGWSFLCSFCRDGQTHVRVLTSLPSYTKGSRLRMFSRPLLFYHSTMHPRSQSTRFTEPFPVLVTSAQFPTVRPARSLFRRPDPRSRSGGPQYFATTDSAVTSNSVMQKGFHAVGSAPSR